MMAEAVCVCERERERERETEGGTETDGEAGGERECVKFKEGPPSTGGSGG